ncbi:MAG: M20 family metallopeptidase [Actinomycetota bacterium]|nr:M20 family metallopeptidase [Actinomycetota bacterium]
MDVRAVAQAVEDRRDAFTDALHELVQIDSGTYTPAGVNRVADLMERRFRDSGWAVDRRSPAPENAELGDLLVARVEGSGRHRVLLVCHMDTVWPEGTVAERPFRLDGDRGYGPGVSDAKSGLLAGVEAVDALRRLGMDSFGRLTFVCNPDEEVGSPFSGPFIREIAQESDVAFVLEAGRENGDIVSARKGVATIRVELLGRAAHAGVEPEKGRHAVLDGAMKAVELQALNGRFPGITVNVGVLCGGTRPNVVPDRCEMEVDVRGWETAALGEAVELIRSILELPGVPGVRATVEPNTEHGPMERSPATVRLVETAQRCARDLGLDIRDASTGGVSDANLVSAVGTPVLDGLGPVGGDDHSPDEWVDLGSVPARVAILAGLIARAGDAMA